MSTYAEKAAKAKVKIQTKGKPLVIRKYTQTGPSFNPTRTPHDENTFGVLLEFTADERGTIIPVDHKKILFPSDFDLREFEEVIDGDDTYQIVNVEELAPGPVCIMYTVQVKR